MAFVVPPVSQMSPSRPGTAANRTFPVAGRPVAADAVNVAPPSVEVENVPPENA